MNVLELRRRTLGKGVYKKTVEGNPAIAQGSLARRYPGITMQGWTEQQSTTGAQILTFPDKEKESVVLKGITYTFNADESITVRGTATERSYIKLANHSQKIKLPQGNYTIGIGVKCPSGSSVLIGEYNEEGGYKRTLARFGAEIMSKTFAVSEESGNIDAYFDISSGNTINLTIYPMLNAGSEALPYEPYTGNQPSPSPDYPQEIINAGKYNEETQKWEYEITTENEQTDPDKNQTVLITSDRPLTKWDKLEKRNGQWGWVYKSAEIESYTDESVPGEYYSTTGQLSVSAQVWYETATKNFVPLSPEEQKQMNALHTFRPTTVLSNDCGCNMELTYKTKKSLEVTD